MNFSNLEVPSLSSIFSPIAEVKHEEPAKDQIIVPVVPGVGGGKSIRRSTGGKGASGPKRHRKKFRDNILGVTKPAIRRLARRGGVKRIAGDVYEHQRTWVRKFLDKIVGDAIIMAHGARRKTVTLGDVLNALKHNGKTMLF